MKRALVLLLAASGCSVLFDPSKVDAGLAATGGGDAGCTSSTAAAPPDWLEGFSDGTSGALTWRWAPVSGVTRYRLCTDGACVDTTCDQPSTCSAAITGLADGQTVTGTVASLDACGLVGSASAPARGVPFALSSTAGWTVEQNNQCGQLLFTSGGGQLELLSDGAGCDATFTLGDGLDDVVLEAELNNSSTNKSVNGGFLLWNTPAGGYRVRTLSGAQVGFKFDTAILTERLPPAADVTAAESPWEPKSDVWRVVRVVASGRVVTWLEGPSRDQLTEVARWVAGAPHTGSVGLALTGQGRLSVRNLTLTTRAELSTDATAATSYDFHDPEAMPGVRSFFAPAAIECPALPGCEDAGTCSPPASGKCLFLHGNGYLLFPVAASMMVTSPAGLDPSREWEVQLRFAALPQDAGLSQQVLGLQATPLVEVTNATTGKVGGIARALSTETWHDLSLFFPPDGGVVQARLDGEPYGTSVEWPGAHGRSLDSLKLGNGANAGGAAIYSLDVRQR